MLMPTNITVLKTNPLVMTFDSGVDHATVQAMAAHDRFQKSLGYDFNTKGSSETDWRRSSTWYDTLQEFRDLHTQLINTASQTSGIDFSPSQGEPMQLTRYQVGEYYRPHWDHFNFPNLPQIDNDRIATLIWYLNDGFEGGATHFTQLNITVTPKQGRCLLFYYPDESSKTVLMHEGCPVAAGEKTIATIWIRARAWT
jgi:hypothetical protein